jgi:hypothetical protein
MPFVMITKTLGRNIVSGQIRNLPGTTIRALEEEHGSGWYRSTDPLAKAKLRRQAAKATES